MKPCPQTTTARKSLIIVQLVERLPSVHEVLDSISSTHTWQVVHACNPSYRGGEAGGSREFKGHLQLHTCWGYLRPCPEKQEAEVGLCEQEGAGSDATDHAPVQQRQRQASSDSSQYHEVLLSKRLESRA